MPEVTITYNIDAHLMPLLEAMRGKRELADFLRGATELGVSELLSDAARRIADRQVADLQELQHDGRASRLNGSSFRSFFRRRRRHRQRTPTTKKT